MTNYQTDGNGSVIAAVAPKVRIIDAPEPHTSRQTLRWAGQILQHVGGFLYRKTMGIPSFEMNSLAEAYPSSQASASTQDQVGALLTHLLPAFQGAERRFRVSKQAIAGVIAWEAIQNPQMTSVFAGANSLGKIHTRNLTIPIVSGRYAGLTLFDQVNNAPELSGLRGINIIKKPSITQWWQYWQLGRL